MSVAIVDALHLAGTVPAASDRALAEWHDLGRAALAATPDLPDAHLMLAAVAERRRDAAEAAKQLRGRRRPGPGGPRRSGASARVLPAARPGRDGPADARSPRIRRSADAVAVPGDHRGGDSEGRPRGPSPVPDVAGGPLPARPRSAVWAARLLEGAGKPPRPVHSYRQVTEAFPAFADGWSARLLAAARRGSRGDRDDGPGRQVRPRPTGVLRRVRRVRGRGPGQRPGWSPPANTSADRRAYAEACVCPCDARGRLADAVPVLTAIAEDQSPPGDAAWARRTLAVLAAALGSPDRKREAVDALRRGPDAASPRLAKPGRGWPPYPPPSGRRPARTGGSSLREMIGLCPP